MKRKMMIAYCATILISLTGCAKDPVDNKEKEEYTSETIANMAEMEEETDYYSVEMNNKEIDSEQEMIIAENSESETPETEETLNDLQQNSIAMLNYLSYLTQDINNSSNSRLYMEEVFTALVDNTYPNSVDPTTEIYISGLLDTIKQFRMIDAKRERLEYIYEQNKAQAMNEAVPNPLGLLSAVKSFNMVDLVGSVVYMAVDSYTSYKSATNQADMAYLESGWELDDEQAEAFFDCRSDAFEYMIDVVRNYDLPGDYALNESAVKDFVDCKNETNNISRIQTLESKKNVYREFGSYWILLADSYYQNGNYKKCLDAITEYLKKDVRILRHNTELAKVLPLAISSAEEVYEGDEYIKVSEPFVELIEKNALDSEWAIRYFAAQTYIDFYRINKNEEYLEKAYDIVLNNVIYLKKEQKNLNEKYLNPIEKQESHKDATKAEKEEIKDYNKYLEEERKTELPPVYEPLTLNCELLFSLEDLRNVDQAEKTRIDSIIHDNGKELFLVKSVDNLFRLEKNGEQGINDIEFKNNGTELYIPVSYITDDVQIKVSVDSNGIIDVYEDWKIDKVKRKTETDISTYVAIFSSETIENQKYNEDSKVKIEIIPTQKVETEVINCTFAVDKYKDYKLIKDIVFTMETNQ